MKSKLFFLLLAGFLLRLILSSFGTLELDFNTYLAWSNRLVESGFANFYQVWSDYLPGYLYILWFLGKLKLLLPFLPTVTLYKLPAILADIFSGYLIYKLLKKSKLRMLATVAYVFNPAIWANSTLWGQTDSLTVLAALLWWYWRKSSPYLAAITLGLGMAFKPTLILLAPFAISHMPLALIAFILTFLPFSPNLPQLPGFILSRLFTTANQYPYTSVHAFNLWQLIHGSWHSDAQFQVLGWSLFAGISFLFLLRARFRITPRLLAGVFLAAWLLLTRMHERHLLPALPFLLLTSPALYAWYSLSYLLNLRFSYVAVTTAYQSQFLPLIATRILSFLNLIGLFLLFFRFKPPRLPHLPQLPKSSWSISLVACRLLLVALLIFSLFIRLYRLHLPEKFYFDEVYHAFTATEMLKGNPQAWEWWNPNPPDVAYEWTHPPLAKEFMIAGMWLFGPNSFGWRFPAAILGVANIFLVYLLARRLFSSPTIAVLASALFSLDGLNLVQSRIGMNDTYLLFFLLLTLLLFLKQKYFFSSLTFGLALASKWSAVYLLPVLAITYFLREKLISRKTLLLAISYLPLAAAIYLAAYLPFFTSGHSLKQFIELHQQMYWYHTKLVATHPYQSSALTWPLNLRPVWYYVDYQDTTVANIYALGNPLIFWSGLLAVIYSLFASLPRAQSKGHKPILLLVTCYLLLFLPWVFSPRIMFLYHYLPATPFMVILLAWLLSHFSRRFVTCYLLLVICVFIFFYPLWTAIPVSQAWANVFFWLPSWK